MWVAPRASSSIVSRSSTSACWSVKFGCSASGVPESASRWRLSAATTSFSSTRRRASVVPMKPAPPVMKIRLPLSTRRVYRRATVRPACASPCSVPCGRRRGLWREPRTAADATRPTSRSPSGPRAATRATPRVDRSAAHPLAARCRALGRLHRAADDDEAVRRRSGPTRLHGSYGGPQQALIAGTFKGNRVWAQLGMRIGCQIARAKRLASSCRASPPPRVVTRAVALTRADRASPGRLRRRWRSARATRRST